MGRQILVYMTRSDESEFMKWVSSTGDVWVAISTSETKQPRVARALPTPEEIRDWGTVYLFNKQVSSNLVTYFLPSLSRYAVDPSASSVIEFARCRIADDAIRQGRLWAEFTFPDSSGKKLLSKESAFQHWYESIAKWLRAKYVRVGPMTYAGPEASSARARGVDFE